MYLGIHTFSLNYVSFNGANRNRIMRTYVLLKTMALMPFLGPTGCGYRQEATTQTEQ